MKIQLTFMIGGEEEWGLIEFELAIQLVTDPKPSLLSYPVRYPSGRVQ